MPTDANAASVPQNSVTPIRVTIRGQGDLAMTYALTQHAAVRTQQRGVPHHLIDALMSYADFEAPVGGGCTVL